MLPTSSTSSTLAWNWVRDTWSCCTDIHTSTVSLYGPSPRMQVEYLCLARDLHLKAQRLVEAGKCLVIRIVLCCMIVSGLL